MTNNEFLTLWNDICGHYGYREVANIRIIKAYCKAAEAVEDKNCQSVLSDIMIECERFPGLGKFTDICSRYKPSVRKSRYENTEKCWYCVDVGSIFTEDNVAYACPKCNMGKKFLYQNFMPYDKKFGNEALEKVAENHKKASAVPVEVSKAKFLDAVSRWKITRLV